MAPPLTFVLARSARALAQASMTGLGRYGWRFRLPGEGSDLAKEALPASFKRALPTR